MDGSKTRRFKDALERWPPMGNLLQPQDEKSKAQSLQKVDFLGRMHYELGQEYILGINSRHLNSIPVALRPVYVRDSLSGF